MDFSKKHNAFHDDTATEAITKQSIQDFANKMSIHPMGEDLTIRIGSMVDIKSIPVVAPANAYAHYHGIPIIKDATLPPNVAYVVDQFGTVIEQVHFDVREVFRKNV
jgi:hypothetical protein